jgi:hypothetical protein
VLRAQRLRVAQSAWGEAMTAHKLAAPDLGFAARLRSLAAAAGREREACEEADRAGLLWRPIPGAQGAQPPYELRPGTGRRGPERLWQRFDNAVEELNHAITGTNVRLVGRKFGELASTAAALADVVDAEDQRTLLELRGDAV